MAESLDALVLEFERIGDRRCAVRCLLGSAREKPTALARPLIDRADLIAGEMKDATLRAAVRDARESAGQR